MVIGVLPKIVRHRLGKRHTTDKFLPEALPFSPELVRHRRKRTRIGDHDASDGGQG